MRRAHLAVDVRARRLYGVVEDLAADRAGEVVRGEGDLIAARLLRGRPRARLGRLERLLLTLALGDARVACGHIQASSAFLFAVFRIVIELI
jgi:hypothetical protein